MRYNPLMSIDVKKVAKLANLQVSDDETEKFEKQLSSVLDYINKLNEVDTSGVKETSQVTGLENVTRKDETSDSLSQKEALSGAKVKKDGYFQVEGVLKNG